MQDLEVLIPIVLFISVFGMIILLGKFDRDTKLKMIENGMNPQEGVKQRRKSGGNGLKFGGVLIGAGIGVFAATMISQAMGLDEDATTGVFFGLIGLFAGIGLVIAHQIVRKQEKEDDLLGR